MVTVSQETLNKIKQANEAFSLYEKLDDELEAECQLLINPILAKAPISAEEKRAGVKIIRDFYKSSRNEDGDINLLGYDLLIAKLNNVYHDEDQTKKREMEILDHQMKMAGMIPLSQMLKDNPLDKFTLHKGVDTLELFEKWLNMRFEEMMKLKMKMILDKKEDKDMFEWILSHAYVLGEIRTQFNACKNN
jgi:hypothetical protein